MDFRWIAAITLWTMLSGPVLIHWSTVIPRPHSSQPGDRPAPFARQYTEEFATPVVFIEDASR